MEFRPYRYTKRIAETAADSGGGAAQEETLWSFDTVFPAVLVFIGSLILATQLALPLISKPPSWSLLRPVSGDSRPSVLGGQVVRVGEARSQEGTVSRDDFPLFFYLSIPKLGITGAQVKRDTVEKDPADFLGHLQGSALPGETGTVFIYGHSTFPYLFDPTKYRTIFSTLDRLHEGDEIILSYPGARWKYEVGELRILKPEEVDQLVLSGDEKRLILMTCYPLGTSFKRLLVLGRLAN